MKRFFGRRKEKEIKEENSEESSEFESEDGDKKHKNKTSKQKRGIKKDTKSKKSKRSKDENSDSEESCESDEHSSPETQKSKSKPKSGKSQKQDINSGTRKKKEKVNKDHRKPEISDEEITEKKMETTSKSKDKLEKGRKQFTENVEKPSTSKGKESVQSKKSSKKDKRDMKVLNEEKLNKPKSKLKADQTKDMKKNNANVSDEEETSKSRSKQKTVKSKVEENKTSKRKGKSPGSHDEDMAAFQGKPRNCSLKQAAVTRFSLKSDDIQDGASTSREVESETESGSDNDESTGDEDEEDTVDGEDESEHEITDSVKKLSKKRIPLENQAKFYQDRAVSVEKHYGQFCQLFGSITRKMARTRDKGDLLSKQLLEYAKQEKISHSTSKNLTEFAHNLAAVQDYRDAEIRRLETKVVKPMSTYGSKCKTIKQLVKREQGAINREIKQRKNLDKVRDKKPGDAHSISAAETEVKKAAESAQIGIQGLQNQMCTFEKEKLTDLKKVLADFVSIELVFHAKAIEFYSKCFDNLAMIDEEMDLEEFKRKITLEQGAMQFGPQAPVPTGTITSVASEQMMSTLDSTGSEYTSTGASYTYTYGDSTMSSGGEKRVRIQTVGQSMYADDDDDDDDDDDYEDDDDDEDEAQNYSRPIRR